MQDLVESLATWRDDLIDGAVAQLQAARLAHYEREGLQTARARLTKLFDVALRCLAEGRVDPMLAHAVNIAHERFGAGFVLLEVQTAINVLEEALWKRVLATVSPEEVAGALGLINAVLGACKDALARTYVELAANGQAPRS